ncbi:MAG TPA: sugar kinase [Anaerolineales bacterium]|nr:sugar kinase [Anaerolineales bacterium]
MYDVITFGEAMIRLSPPDHQRLEQVTSLEVAVGGAELSVAAGVARLGLRSAWVSRLAGNPLGRMMANKGREFGVDTSHVLWAEDERAGLYFVEYGATPRPTRVIYDRKDSALARIQPHMLDWQTLLSQTRLFHVGGITPALSASAAETQAEALRLARGAGCLVSYDLNFRAMLWTLEQARAAQLPLMEYVDILITSLPDQPNVTELISGLSGENPGEVARKLAERYGFKAVLVTMRSTPSVTRSVWTSLAYTEGQVLTDRSYEVEAVDRLGGGDACVAGFLTGYLEGDPAQGVRLGNAFSALKQTSPTDWPWPTREEVEALILQGESSMKR